MQEKKIQKEERQIIAKENKERDNKIMKDNMRMKKKNNKEIKKN